MRQERYKRQRSTLASPEGDNASRQKQLAIAGHQEDVIEKEASNFAEGRISVCLVASGTGGARQSVSEIMHAAKKLVLVDEFDREYKRLQKPTDAVAKTNSSLHLSNTLRNQSLSDDQKVRQYVAALHKYINTRAEVPEEPIVKTNTTTEVTPPVRRGRPKRRQRWTPY